MITSLSEAEIGKSYRVVAGPEGLPTLEPLEGRGRPRGLSGPEVVAARALRSLDKSFADIALTLNTSIGAVRTALGAPR